MIHILTRYLRGGGDRVGWIYYSHKHSSIRGHNPAV